MTHMKNTSWIVIILLATGSSQDVPSDEHCKLNDSESRGVCVVTQSCQQAIDLLKLNDRKSLERMRCGFDGKFIKVCCPNATATNDIIVFSNNVATTNHSSDPTLTTTKEPNLIRPEPIASIPIYIPLLTTTLKTQPESIIDDKSSDGSANSSIYTIYQELENLSDVTQHHVIRITDKKQYVSKSSQLPDRNTCGLFTLADRIFGGDVTAIDEFPWLVRIRYRLNRGIEYACAGSLINNLYVITAAHCVVNQMIIDVRLGEWDEEKEAECYGTVCNDPPIDLKVVQVIVHPDYSKRTFSRGDIALLRLERSVNFTDFIRPVCLPNTDFVSRQDYTPDGTYLTAGWGQTEFGNKSPVKRKVQLNAVTMSVCRVAHHSVLTDEMAAVTICAGGRKSQDSCRGDSGGSLVKQVTENDITNWFLYGITSFGTRKCGNEGTPGLYTRVSRYMDWILKNIEL